MNSLRENEFNVDVLKVEVKNISTIPTKPSKIQKYKTQFYRVLIIDFKKETIKCTFYHENNCVYDYVYKILDNIFKFVGNISFLKFKIDFFVIFNLKYDIAHKELMIDLICSFYKNLRNINKMYRITLNHQEEDFLYIRKSLCYNL